MTGSPFPVAPKIPTARTFHGDTFVDDYEWLRDTSSPRTKAFVAAQNRIAQERLGRLKPLSDRLFEEMSSRIRQTDMSVPVRMDGWWYFARTVEGQQYGVQCRVSVADKNDWTPPRVTGDPGSMHGEQIYMDANEESRGHDFFALGTLDISHDGGTMLVGVDTNGDERYDLFLRRLPSGVARPDSSLDLPDRITGTGAGACLTPDAVWVFYPRLDAAHRPFQIWRHKVGTDASADVPVYEEKDERFFVGVSLSFDERWLVISSSSKTTSEILRLSVTDPTGTFTPVIARKDGVDYDIAFARLGDEDGSVTVEDTAGTASPGMDAGEPGFPVAFVIHDSRDENYEIDVIDLSDDPSGKQKRLTVGEGTVIARGSTPQDDPGTRVGLRIEGIEIYRRFLVLAYRRGGVPRLAVCTKSAATAAFRQGRPWPFRDVEPGKGLGDPADLDPVDHDGDAHHSADRGSSEDGPESSHSRQAARQTSATLSADASSSDITTQIDGPVWDIDSVGMPSYDEPHLRYTYGSWTRPSQLHELDVATGADRLLKKQEVLGGFDAGDCRERLVRVPARDGALVPVSLAWKPSAPGMGPAGPVHPAPLFVIGYGAYGMSSDPAFSVSRLSFLDRGVLYATVHVRGGASWAGAGTRTARGRRTRRTRSPTSSTRSGGCRRRTGRSRAHGGGRGRRRPAHGRGGQHGADALHAIEADVPPGDALTSILKPELPLTVTEWEEWGDPLHDPEVYRYMRSYSPYENVEDADTREKRFGTRAFPHIFATTSLTDTRVLAVEPLKWIARLQEPAVGADAFVRVEDEGGHAGASGRYRAWHRLCEENAWCLSQMGITR